MTDINLPAPGESAAIESLGISRARELSAYLVRGVHPWARFIETRTQNTGRERIESVVFEVDVELSQLTRFDIHRVERICVSFSVSDDSWPVVFALRQDFPLVPHLHLRATEFPRSLCLYEQTYSEERLHWTPVSMIEHLRSWLSDTALGTLHRPDQPLEPLFLGTRNTILLPLDIYSRTNQGPEQLQIAYQDRKPWGELFIARHLDPGTQVQGGKFIATAYLCPPLLHGVISWIPQTLLDLHSISVSAGGDLLGVLRAQLNSWQRDGWLLKCQLVLIVLFPKVRESSAAVETFETWVFISDQLVEEIGEALGIWQINQGIPGQLIGLDRVQERADQITLLPLNPTFGLNRERSARQNGTTPDSKKITAVGLGALGSQVVTILGRTGFGLWSLVDGDILLPHNFARHTLGSAYVGWFKVDAMNHHLDSLLAENIVERSLFVDVLNPGEREADLNVVLETSDAILDFSASIAVARKLAHEFHGKARRISVFLNPSGSSSILLAEDEQRSSKLDSLEMQYYRAILSRTELSGHFSATDSPIRYARSCRDVSSILPQQRVALHAAVTAGAIKKAMATPEASMQVWVAGDQGDVQSIPIAPANVIELAVGSWRVVTDSDFIAKLSRLRQESLPRETGGVLLGVRDLVHHSIYLVDTILAPPDSKKRTTSFIRGCEGLLNQVRAATQATAGMVQYVGEWHSHPVGFDTTPSEYDCELFAWIGEKTVADGYQPVMAIIADEELRCFVGTIDDHRTVAGPPRS